MRNPSFSPVRQLGLFIAIGMLATASLGCGVSTSNFDNNIQPITGLLFLDPVENYAATMETTGSWATTARIYETQTGELTDIVLNDVGGPSTTFDFQCVDGILEDTFGMADLRCADGIHFEGTFPRRFRVVFETSEGEVSLPQHDGVVTLRPAAMGGDFQRATFFIDTDALR